MPFSCLPYLCLPSLLCWPGRKGQFLLSGQLLSKTRMRNMPCYLLQRVTSLETEFSTFKYSFNAVIQNSRSQSWMNKNLEPKSSFGSNRNFSVSEAALPYQLPQTFFVPFSTSPADILHVKPSRVRILGFRNLLLLRNLLPRQFCCFNTVLWFV